LLRALRRWLAFCCRLAFTFFAARGWFASRAWRGFEALADAALFCCLALLFGFVVSFLI
jgi:hypothetical protein